MANKINFITGETYTLSELFSGDRRIIIPDLQRDYCWGDDASTEKGELVTGFVNNIIEQYDNANGQETLNLGLFYGYEVPANHIQLCDGQQRLTTLYLLLGMLNKNVNNKFRRNLISDFEYKQDDKEPYLNYAIRETSLYFMSDLVCKFFIENKDNVESITGCDWYFGDYNLDPSIKSMLKALSIIESLLKEREDKWCYSFGEWLLNKVTFLYFDMENRKNGEETFVVINTTGESLSATQNLKPLVINAEINRDSQNVAEEWEEIETWFWRSRQEANDTADAGLAEFLRWISVIEQVNVELPKEIQTSDTKWLVQIILQGKNKSEFPYETISFETIHTYWKALKWIVTTKDDEERSEFTFVDDLLSPSVKNDVNKLNAIGQNQCFVLLPLLKFVYKNINDVEVSELDFHRNARRIYEFFNNLIRISDVSKAVNALTREAIKIIDLLEGGDIVSLLDHANDVSKQILTEEEKLKLEILKQKQPGNRIEVEEAFWNVQKHPIWNGEIVPIIRWSSSDGSFSLDKFRQYDNKFREAFVGDCVNKIDDTLRRALLTRDLKDYPCIFEGYTNISFGEKCQDWHTLIYDNVDIFKSFFDELINGKSYKEMIDNYEETSNIWYRFIKMPELLAYCEKKNIQHWDNSYCLVQQQRATINHYAELETFCLFLEYVKNEDKPYNLHDNRWQMKLCQEDDTAIRFNSKYSDAPITIDVHYNRIDEKGWNVQVFLGKDENESDADLILLTKNTLQEIASNNELAWNNDIGRYECRDLNREEVKNKINKLQNSPL